MALNVQANVKALGHECDIIACDNIIKKRFVDSRTGNIVLRVDEDDEADSEFGEDYIIEDGYDGIIISDYSKGFLSEKAIESIIRQAKVPVFIDTKKYIGEWLSGIEFIKINELEYERTKAYIPEELERKLIVTLGDKGCVFNGEAYPTPKYVETKNISGAGDTFMAAFVVTYLETKNVPLAIKKAQTCCQIVIQKSGVATI